MSTDPSAALVRHVEAADEGGPSSQLAAISSRDLGDLAAAIERIEALIVSGTGAGSDGAAAIERIADIAFVLHERAVETSLCDALDAALREISEANAVQQAGAQRARQAGMLLRQLSRSINAMIALGQAERHAGTSAATDAQSHAASDEARVEASADHESTLGGDAEIDGVETNNPMELSADAGRKGMVGATGPISATAEAVSRPAIAAQPVAAPAPPPPSSLDPDEDPGDLFEPAVAPPSGPVEAALTVAPLPARAPPRAPAAEQMDEDAAPKPVAAAAPDAAEAHTRSLPISSQSSRTPATPAPRPAGDPLAPIMALNEEEMIALFS